MIYPPGPAPDSFNFFHTPEAVATILFSAFNSHVKKIIDLVSGWQSKGEKFARWEAVDSRGIPLAGGVYIYTIQIGKYRETKKMIFLK